MNDLALRGVIQVEEKLLLSCARTRLDESESESIRECVEQDLDWDLLLAAADRHKLTALVHRHLQAVCSPLVPHSALEMLRAAAGQIARRNLCLVVELLRVLDLFGDHGLLAIPYKGPLLATLAYGNLALREFLDLDIVVRQRDMPKASQLLTQSGYEAELSWVPSEQKFKRQIPGQYVFTRQGDRLIVELHTEKTLRYFPRPINLDVLAERLERVALGGREIPTFAPEDALPILCVHGSKHFWDRLVWICDIAELVQVPRGIDWEKVLANSRELGSGRTLLLGLLLASELLEAPIPEPLLRRARANPAVRSMARTVYRGLFCDKQRLPGVPTRFLFRLRMGEGFRGGLRYSMRLATSPTGDDWDSLRLPRPFASLYSVLHPLRLLRSYGLGRAPRR